MHLHRRLHRGNAGDSGQPAEVPTANKYLLRGQYRPIYHNKTFSIQHLSQHHSMHHTCRAYYKDLIVEVKPFIQKNTIETTGAGDTFCASTLNYVLDHGLENLTEENLKELLTFANAAASLITTRKGALRVMPTREEVEEFIASRK